MLYVVAFLFLLIGFAIFAVIHSIIEHGKRKRGYERLLETLSDSEQLCFQIRYATAARHKRFWKLLPWDSSGLLILQEGGTVIYRYLNSMESREEMLFKLPEDQLRFEGESMANGATIWFSFAKDGVVHYFTSETGAFMVNSGSTTSKIYYRIREVQDALEKSQEAGESR